MFDSEFDDRDATVRAATAVGATRVGKYRLLALQIRICYSY